jgi:hypothetical protein
MRKPARHTRKQSADAPQELQSIARMVHTGSAGEPQPSFCEIKGFTEQKEGCGSPVLIAPDPNDASMKKPPGGGLPGNDNQREDQTEKAAA